MRYYNDVVRYLREHAEEFEPVFHERTVKGKTIQVVDEMLRAELGLGLNP